MEMNKMEVLEVQKVAEVAVQAARQKQLALNKKRAADILQGALAMLEMNSCVAKPVKRVVR